MIKKKDLLPAVVFTFSKKRCESNADNLSSESLTSMKVLLVNTYVLTLCQGEE